MTTSTANLLNTLTKAAAGLAIATTALGSVQAAAEAHTIHAGNGNNNWHFVGQNHRGRRIYASIRHTGFNGSPVVTYDRIKIKPNGQRRFQRVEAVCNGSGLYRKNHGYFQTTHFGSFRRFEINRVCSNANTWRYQRGPMMPVGFSLGVHIH
jgi:hypothetical protein